MEGTTAASRIRRCASPGMFILGAAVSRVPVASRRDQSLGHGGLEMEEEDRGRRNADVKFETIRAEKINFGRNNFLEIARKRATTAEGTNEFISVSRGYYLPDKTERFKRSLTIPDDPEIRTFVADKIKSL